MTSSEHVVDAALLCEAHELAGRARIGARALRRLDALHRRELIEAMASALDAATDDILRANELDIKAANEASLSAALIDRLLLTRERVGAMADGVRLVAALPDPIGKTLDVIQHPSGMMLNKVRVPLGVILMIYESRPNVTADAAALCFKSGNAVLLRGGREAARSNAAIHQAMTCESVCTSSGMRLPPGSLGRVENQDRALVSALLTCREEIDLVIPRGGAGLIDAVCRQSLISVMKHDKGVCHVFVDASANIEKALAIVENAKCQRPGVCNALETLLVHASIASTLLPLLAERMQRVGVELRGCERSRGFVEGLVPATDADWAAEYLDLILAIRVVDSLDDAIDHIERWGSHHSDAIVTGDDRAAKRFAAEVDSAAVYVNASTRFTDGSEFGMGAEIGISTDKLHARGPCGVEALTTYKYIGVGDGTVRT